MFILWHAFAVRLYLTGNFIALYITIILDIFLVFPEASHIKYDITYRQIMVKRLIYPDISFPCSSIISVKKAELLELNNGIISSLGAYKITYVEKRKDYDIEKIVIIGAKEREKFLIELSTNVNSVIKEEIKNLIKDIGRRFARI